ncbi:PPE family protein PPE34-like [Penaeus monodon]|uniref:PPE family protein PPE34-like n=1 Tax=Penaeus monodon TaxID=6687 RepID=UPI0018A75DDA|nr:PPE family protein PPE34-like [Penaeus monodon]
MKLLVLVFFVVFGATASPQGYNLRPPSGPSLLSRRCSAGQVLHVDGVQDPDPIIVPPPKQEHIVYVLNKQLEQSQKVIQVPAPPLSDLRFYFVKYAEGENPVLPIGVDLETALTAADQGNGQSSVGDSSIGGTQESTGAFGVSGNFRGIFGLGRTADSRTTFGLGDVSNSVTNTGLGNGIDSSTNGGLGVGGTANGNAGLGSSVISRTDGGIGAVDNFWK